MKYYYYYGFNLHPFDMKGVVNLASAKPNSSNWNIFKIHLVARLLNFVADFSFLICRGSKFQFFNALHLKLSVTSSWSGASV